ncbi:uncharacterized protein BDW47DRAFT_110875, partial [Aspergillus candidus]
LGLHIFELLASFYSLVGSVTTLGRLLNPRTYLRVSRGNVPAGGRFHLVGLGYRLEA